MHARSLAGLAVILVSASLLVPANVPAQDGLLETLKTIEENLWEGWKNHDGAPFREHLADNAVNVSGGTFGKEANIADIESDACDVESYALSDWMLHRLSEDTVVLTYRGTQSAVCDGERIPENVNVSSVYVRQGGRWLEAVYHESPARD